MIHITPAMLEAAAVAAERWPSDGYCVSFWIAHSGEP